VSELYRIKKVTHTNGRGGYYQVDRDGVRVAIFIFDDQSEIDIAMSRAAAAVEAMRAIDMEEG